MLEATGELNVAQQALERTAAERLGFDMAGFMNIIGHSVSPFPAAVAQLGRWLGTESALDSTDANGNFQSCQREFNM